MIRKHLESVKPYKPGKPIEELKRELNLERVYKLASNEIPFAPKYLKRVIIKEIENINRYPESSSFYLRKRLAEELNIDEERLVLGNGSDEIIVLVLRALIDSYEDEVIVAHPTFIIYELQAKIEKAKVIRVPLKDFRYDLYGMAKKVNDHTKVIFIANPDNPTGTYVSHREVLEFLKDIPKEILVFFDEAYFEFVDKKDFPRTREFLDERGNIVISRTFSKAYGLAGLRIGYAFMDKKLANVLNTIREPFNINRFAQVCALYSLKHKGFMRKVVDYIISEKEYLYREFNRLGIQYTRSVTNFILVNWRKDTSQLNQYLLKEGIIIRELRDWGLENYFRVSVGMHRENKLFIECLKSFMKKKED